MKTSWYGKAFAQIEDEFFYDRADDAIDNIFKKWEKTNRQSFRIPRWTEFLLKVKPACRVILR